MRGIFGTSGVRGILGRDYSVFDVMNISLAATEYFDYRPVLIGWDCRVHSAPLALASASYLQIYGVDVALAGVISTPSLQKYLSLDRNRFGIMFTASHNPPEYFGVKVFTPEGYEVFGEAEEEISRIYHGLGRGGNIDWTISRETTIDMTNDVVSTYVDAIMDLADPLLPKNRPIDMRIGVDYANCSAIATAGRVLTTNLFREIINVNHVMDGRFPGRMPEPTPETLSKTISNLMTKIDIGLAFDGDADRGVIFDGEGRIYWGDQIGAAVAISLGEELGVREVVTPVSTSHAIVSFLESRGVKVVLTPVGAKNIVGEMLRNGYRFGFEENGGLIYSPHILGRDGLLTFMLTVALLAKNGSKMISEVLGYMPRTYVAKKKVKIGGRKEDVMRLVRDMLIDKYSGGEVVELDGVKIILEDLAILVRPSGTEPLIRVFVESSDREAAENTANRIIQWVKEVDSRLTYL